MKLVINQVNPNPANGDQWVEIHNAGSEPVAVAAIQLRRTAFDEFGYACGPELIWAGYGSHGVIAAGRSFRVHDDEDAPLALGIETGDKLSVSWRDAFDQSYLDWAVYAPRPALDAILQRSGNLLTDAWMRAEDSEDAQLCESFALDGSIAVAEAECPHDECCPACSALAVEIAGDASGEGSAAQWR